MREIIHTYMRMFKGPAKRPAVLDPELRRPRAGTRQREEGWGRQEEEARGMDPQRGLEPCHAMGDFEVRVEFQVHS